MRLAALFSDNMVLQQGRELPIWGWGEADEKITVSFAGITCDTTVEEDGTWCLNFEPLSACCEPRDMIFSNGTDEIVVKDVLVGEVWIASGQSNMSMAVKGCLNAEEEIASAQFPGIRMFTVLKAAIPDGQEDVEGRWETATPEYVDTFSAVGYFFARMLHQRLEVPVGVINSSWGGTIAEAWISKEALEAMPEYADLLKDYDHALENFDEIKQSADEIQKMMDSYIDPGEEEIKANWQSPDLDDSDWDEMKVPNFWNQAGYDFNGVFYFRKTIEVPEDWAGKELMLNLLPCDKIDITWFNGVKVGSMGFLDLDAWCSPRYYKIPGNLVKAGKNTISVRIYSHIYDGGIHGDAKHFNIFPVDEPDNKINLAGQWKLKLATKFGKFSSPPGQDNPNSPYILHKSMLEPIIPYAMRGVLWYQGESNTSKAKAYQTLFPAMIQDWREKWGQGDFPFLTVQLANYMARTYEPCESNWAELREAQLMSLTLPNTGLAVTIDVGEAADIHPRNKQAVGYRLACWALGDVFLDSEQVISGPLFKDCSMAEGSAYISFDHLGGGLACQGDKLTGFAICGEDKEFKWADAVIDGDQVVVSNKEIPEPVAVRYAWANNPECNLYNKAGFPASPFRTDS